MTLDTFPTPVEGMVRAHLLTVDGVSRVGTVTPSDLASTLPFVRVSRIGGTDDRLSDFARVDVDVYAASEMAGYRLAETLRQTLISGPARTSWGLIDRVTTEVAPRQVPYDNPAVWHVTATYRVATRRR